MEQKVVLDEWNEQKKQGGAGKLVSRMRIIPSISLPQRIVSNIKVPILPLKEHNLCFLPDMLMILGSNEAQFVSYASMQADSKSGQFVEESQSTVPSDALVVGETWK